MFMFLPFLIALAVVLAAITGKDKTSYILWAALLIVTVLCPDRNDGIAASFFTYYAR